MNLHRLSLAVLSVVVPLFASAAEAPDLRFATEQGEMSLAQLRGKVVYLDYWASWCGPCRESFPWMNELQSRYGDKGLVVLAVNVDAERAEAERFLTEHPANFRIAWDPKGDTARTLRVKGMPSSFLLDREGNIVASHIGFREKQKAGTEDEIRALTAPSTHASQ